MIFFTATSTFFELIVYWGWEGGRGKKGGKEGGEGGSRRGGGRGRAGRIQVEYELQVL